VDATKFGIPPEKQMPQMWDIAIKELQRIERQMTPRAKQHCITSCFKMINQSFSLFTSDKLEEANADDMVDIFPYIVLKSKIERLYAHLK